MAEYIGPLNLDRRVANFSTRSTPASLKSSQSLSKPTGYGPQCVGLDRSYSTIRNDLSRTGAFSGIGVGSE
jgi:hypothetical protein